MSIFDDFRPVGSGTPGFLLQSLPLLKQDTQWVASGVTETRGSSLGGPSCCSTAGASTYTSTLSTNGIVTTVENGMWDLGTGHFTVTSTETIDLNTGNLTVHRTTIVVIDPVNCSEGTSTTQIEDSTAILPITFEVTGVELSVDKIRVAQVVFDPSLHGDEIIDLVQDKLTVVIATVSSTGAQATDTSSVDFDLTLCGVSVPFTNMKPPTLTLGQLTSETEVQLYFIPAPPGPCVLEVTIDPDNLISPSGPKKTKPTMVDIKATRGLHVGYYPVSCSGSSCYGQLSNQLGSIADTVTQGGAFVKATYPIAVYSGEVRPAFVGDPVPCLGVFNDILSIGTNAWAAGFDKGIGIVPSDYFTYHNFNAPLRTCPFVSPETKGAAFCYGRGGVVMNNRWATPAHELGHMHGLGCVGPFANEEYSSSSEGNPASGFWVEKQQPQDGRVCFMGNFPDKNGTGKNWIDDAHYIQLFDTFLVNPSDPEVVLVTALLHMTGEWLFVRGTSVRVARLPIRVPQMGTT